MQKKYTFVIQIIQTKLKLKIMKKLLLVVAMVILGFSANAQDGRFNLGANIGLPVGDAGDITSFVIALEANYLFEVADEFEVGPAASFVNYFGKNNFSDFSFLPLAVAGRFSASEEFTLGADLGYGIALSPSGLDGGFYYRPMVGYNIKENLMLQLSYSGISVNGGTFGNVGVGAMFQL